MRWIGELGDEDPEVRERASCNLRGIAEFLSDADCAALQAASTDQDVERAVRARNLLRDIGLRRALGPALLADLRDFEAGRMERDDTARPLLEKVAGRWGGGGVDDGQVEALVDIVLRSGWEHGLDARFMRERRLRPFARFFEELPDSERAVMLGLSGNRRYVPGIAGLLRSDIPQVQQAAARALGWIGDPSVASELLRLLDSNSADVRQASLWALAELRSEIPDAKIEALLADVDQDVRRAAAYAVVRLRKVNAVVALAKAWELDHSRWREEFISYLAHMCDERLHMAYRKELLRNDLGSRLIVSEAFIRTTRPWHVQEIADLISSGVETALDVAPDAVPRLEPAEARAALAPLLQDPRAKVREAAVEALSRVVDGSAGELLAAAMKDPDAKVRANALWGFARQAGFRAETGLEALKDPQLAATALLFLGRYGAYEHRARIVERLRDEDSGVRRAAVEALRDLDARDALTPVKDLWTDPAEDVRREATFTVILWAGDTDAAFLRVQAKVGTPRDQRLAAAELLFQGDHRYLASLREQVGRGGNFGEGYWDGRPALLEPLFADSCLQALDSGDNPHLSAFTLARLAETAALYWDAANQRVLLARLRRLSDHPDEETRLFARIGRLYLEYTPATAQLEVLEELRGVPDRNYFLRDPFFRSLAFAHAPEAFRDLGTPFRLKQEVRGDAGFASHLRARGYVVDSGSCSFVGRRGPGSWITALASFRPYRGAFVIEGKKIRVLEVEDPMEYWKNRLSR